MYNVLIIDDRDIFLLDLKRMKFWGERSGFEITGTASNGKQALDLLRLNTYDMVLTDIRMPIIDGIQLLREIKKEGLCPCVVLLSEHSEFAYARQGIVLGAFDYLVKPATEESLLELFERARGFLEVSQNHGPSLSQQSLDKDAAWIYPSTEENLIINCFRHRDNSVNNIFRTTIDNIYFMMANNLIKADIVVKKLYGNVIAAVYHDYPWLENFLDMHDFENMDYIHEGAENSARDFYCRKIEGLTKLIKKYQPNITDPIISEIIAYILGNFESDIKLKTISEKFYINHTYLSNTFAAKVGVNYNDYVTMVKMSRAKYLFKHTTLKTYEIGYQVGYHDINYFSKLFKKYYGQSPTEYRNNDYIDYQI